MAAVAPPSGAGWGHLPWFLPLSWLSVPSTPTSHIGKRGEGPSHCLSQRLSHSPYAMQLQGRGHGVSSDTSILFPGKGQEGRLLTKAGPLRKHLPWG